MEPDSRIKELLEKYWQAETSEAEEAELKEYFAQNPGFKDHPAGALFNYLREEQQIAMTDSFDEKFQSAILRKAHFTKWLYPLLKVAAVILIVFSFVYILLPESKPKFMSLSENDTYADPEKAYQETKKALLLISQNLSTGKSYMSEIGKINKAQQLINTKENKR
jgi:hypothetical protein